MYLKNKLIPESYVSENIRKSDELGIMSFNVFSELWNNAPSAESRIDQNVWNSSDHFPVFARFKLVG